MVEKRADKSFSEKTPADLRRDFRRDWISSYVGNFPIPEEGKQVQDSTIQVEAYEVIADPLSQRDRRHLIHEFGLKAVSAGFEIVGTIVVPHAGYLENRREVAAVTFLLKSPIEKW
ncbi:MAG: hypothetical protein HYT08_03570 [Candidatus Levybacteria bacterium]|nr:hypothetical protein [Candidatus Levybacteria bacterium]